MLARLWTTFNNLLETFMKQRVTLPGLLFSAASVMVALAAFVSANNLLFLLFAMMLATMLVSGLVSRLSLAGLQVDCALPEHISAGQKVAARIAVYNEKSWMTSFSVRLTGVPPSAFTTTVYFPAIPSRSLVRETVEVEFRRRGAYREKGFEVGTRFPFGFTERRIQVSLSRDVLVYPSLRPQPGFDDLLAAVRGDIESRQRGRGTDFYRIRPYEPLESSRLVDWKATAHTGNLQVREFAAEQDPLVEIFLDLNVPQDQREWFERAVECCAFVAWHTCQRECRIWFRTQDFELLIPLEGDIYALLRYLALVSPGNSGDLPEPGNGDGYRILFTARPRQAEEAGWLTAQMVDPELQRMDE